MKTLYQLNNLSQVVATHVLPLFKKYNIFLFQGTLGAGKTTLVKEILRQLGVKDGVTSPTFTYVNEYQNHEGQRFYHFDLYRLDSVQDFLDAGFDEYLEHEGAVVLIEWPEVIQPFLEKMSGVSVCSLKLQHSSQGLDQSERNLSIVCHPLL